MDPFDVGKLPPAVLGPLIERAARSDPRVLLGPAVGEDAAVIDMGEHYLVAKSDPVTFASDEIGWYAVHVNANDVACCGARPRWFMATVLLPECDTDEARVGAIFDQIRGACDELDVTLCGGHTEITHGLARPIVCGHMLGEVDRGEAISTAGARVGDALVLTKGIAVEGTAIVARERGAALAPALGADLVARAAGLLRAPGISVVRDASTMVAAGEVHALHDPTEGGLATGLHELAGAAGVGLVVEAAHIRVLEECRACCRQLELDPLGLIASGSLLAAVAPGDADAIVGALRGAGIEARIIGEVRDASEGVRLRSVAGELGPLPAFARDELARLLAVEHP